MLHDMWAPHRQAVIIVLLCPLIQGTRARPEDKGEIAARLNSAGLDLMKQGRIKEAVESFRQALERDPENVDCLANLGVALVRQGNPVEAVEVLQRATRRRPNDPRLSSDLAAALGAAGRPHEAAAQMRKSCSLAPRDAVIRRNEEHTSELQSPCNLVCRLLLEKKKKKKKTFYVDRNQRESTTTLRQPRHTTM